MAFRMNIFTNPKKLRKKIQAVNDKEKIDELNEQIRSLAREAVEKVKAATPGTGKVRAGWEAKHTTGPKGKIYKTVIRNNYPNKDILKWLEYGTRPHIIRPREAPFLTFWWKKENRLFTHGLIVHHPGTKPRNLLGRARRAMQVVTAIVANFYRKIFGGKD